MTATQGKFMTPESEKNSRLIDQLILAYNAQDARRFADLFSEDAWHGDLHGSTFETGREAIYRRYVQVFAAHPGNRTEILNRIAFDDFVIDHERVHRNAETKPFEVAAIYTIQGDRIRRLEMVRMSCASPI
jgi:uncharacterized protein (TIGR02246 family)